MNEETTIRIRSSNVLPLLEFLLTSSSIEETNPPSFLGVEYYASLPIEEAGEDISAEEQMQRELQEIKDRHVERMDRKREEEALSQQIRMKSQGKTDALLKQIERLKTQLNELNQELERLEEQRRDPLNTTVPREPYSVMTEVTIPSYGTYAPRDQDPTPLKGSLTPSHAWDR